MGFVALPKRSIMVVSESREVARVGRKSAIEWRWGGGGSPSYSSRSDRFFSGVCRALNLEKNGGGLAKFQPAI